ncbi:hypothetical protein ACFQO4_20665 [Saliphagus sp. GCM10025334]
MVLNQSTRDTIEHEQRKRRGEAFRTRKEAVNTAIRRCSRALDRGETTHYQYVARKLSETILPGLEDQIDGLVVGLAEDLADHEYWDYPAYRRFTTDETRIREVLAEGARSNRSRLALESAGVSDELETAKRLVERTFKTAVAIAEHLEVVTTSYTNAVDCVGHTTKLGVHLQDWDMDIGDPIHLFSDQAGPLKTLYCGGTGTGKSTGMGRETEDYYLRNFVDGKDIKLIDLVGMRDGENWFYDVPQQQEPLRKVREELGLAPDFTGTEFDERQMEILLPLTKGLNDQELPFDTENEEFVCRPFTVPACEIRKPLLVSLIMSRVSESEEQTIREVYDEVDADKTDWSLGDIAEEIRLRPELSDKHKAKAIGVLRGLQNEGFIRTREDPYAIQWKDIFYDTQTITVFSQAFCRTEISKVMAFAYLCDSILEQRKQDPFVPDCGVIMRELWSVAPHKQRQSFDSRVAAIQEAIGQVLMRMFRENRHYGVHVFADTQQPSDLLKSIREMFNRYVVYGANYDTIDDIMSWTQNNRKKAFWGTMSARRGEAGVIGMVEPAVENHRIEFVSPVRYAPPSHHHRDAAVDKTGWHGRVQYLENEELRKPADVDGVIWDDEIHPSLVIDPFNGDGTESDGVYDPEATPAKAFIQQCLTHEWDARIKKSDVYTAFHEFAVAHGHDRDRWDFEHRGVQSQFGAAVSSVIEDEVANTKIDGDVAYRNLRFTKKGEEFLEEATVDIQSAAEPIHS